MEDDLRRRGTHPQYPACLSGLANLANDPRESLERSPARLRKPQRSAARASDREARLLRTLLQSLDFPMYVIDANTREIVLANAAMCRSGPPWGMTCYAVTHHRASPCEGWGGPCPLETVRRTKRPVTIEHRHHDADGRVRYYEIHAVPVLDDEGNLTEMIEYNIDVTARRRATDESRVHERALELLVKQLELSNQELAKFASATASDIRSPLESISASAATLGLLLGNKSDDTVRRAFEILGTGVDRLSRLVNGLYRCCQASTDALHVVDIDVARLVREICTFQLAQDIEASGGRIHVEESAYGVRGDERLILELLQNLIGNALTFSREGVPPEIRIRTLAVGDERVRIEIDDNGIGVPQGERERIFEMFTRLDDKASDGLGIGLVLCKRIAQRHGGRVGVESRNGTGSTFWVELPSAPTAVAAP